MIAIDNLEWGFEPTTFLDPVRDIPDNLIPKIGEGVFVYDMYLEGAGWHLDNKYLKDAIPMKLYEKMPIVKFVPLKIEPKSKKY